MDNLIEKLAESASYIREKAGDKKIDIAIVLGSGLGELADKIEKPVIIDYHDIPNFPVSTVPGHKGRLVIGRLENRRVICMQGRFHYYEGWSMAEVVYPIRVFKMLGIKNLFLTNAAGCVNKSWKPGDLMIIKDHIKLIADNPCRGENYPELGERFFDMTNCYSPELIEVARSAAKKEGVDIKEGVYMLFTGPAFETKSEVRVAMLIGADAVGMSTVPECIAASQMKMNTIGISCLTNMGAGLQDKALDHIEVIDTGNRVRGIFERLVREILRSWPEKMI